MGTRVLQLFIDGIGIGPRKPAINPFAVESSALFGLCLEDLPLDGPHRDTLYHAGGALTVWWAVADPGLDVPGVPQSATGQAALLSGRNAAKAMGKHVPAFPGPRLKAYIQQGTILSGLKAEGYRVGFLNAYQPDYFQGQRRDSVTTLATLAAGLPLLTLEDLVDGKALYHDFTNGILVDKGYPVPRCSPEEAGSRLATMARQYDYSLYEYFLTDVIGHSKDMERAAQEVQQLRAFLTALLARINPAEELVLLTTDHGNLERMDLPDHTENPVPIGMVGRGARGLAEGITCLTDVAAAVKKAITSDSATSGIPTKKTPHM